MKQFTFIVLLLYLSCTLTAQDEKNLEKILKKAHILYKQLKYHKAIPYYEKAILEKKKYTVGLRTRLAFCYRMINNMTKAEVLYEDLVLEPKVKPITYYYYGETLMANGKYDAAKLWFWKYHTLKPRDSRGEAMALACERVKYLRPVFPNVVSRRLEFNTESDDYAPMFYEDGLIFVSDRIHKQSGRTYDWTGRAYSNIFYAEKETAYNFSAKSLPFSRRFNKKEKNSGPASLSGNGKYFFFSRNSDIPNKEGNKYMIALFMTEADGRGGWKKPKKLPFCRADFNFMHPAASHTGDTLYFVSDKPLGFGETDIYMTYKNKKGKWVYPINLGEKVNTSEREAFPFIHQDGTLYFCSKGHTGYGGFDVFLTKANRRGEFERCLNLGSTINSPKDDVGFILSSDKSSGYFASNRKDGNDDDIYYFTQKNVFVAFEGEIYDEQTRAYIAGATITLETFDEQQEVLSTTNGLFRFKGKIDRAYLLKVAKDGYWGYQRKITTKGIMHNKLMTMNIGLESMDGVYKSALSHEQSIEEEEEEEYIDNVEIKVTNEHIDSLEVLEPAPVARGMRIVHPTRNQEKQPHSTTNVSKTILWSQLTYAENQFVISGVGRCELDKFVKLLKDNPTVRIELRSHADNQKEAVASVKLSKNRAKAAAGYLISQGIEPNRIISEGYGTTELLVPCKKDKPCTTTQHGMNRRTEIRVIAPRD